MKQLYLSIPQRIQLNQDEVRLGDIAQVIAEVIWVDNNIRTEVVG